MIKGTISRYRLHLTGTNGEIVALNKKCALIVEVSILTSVLYVVHQFRNERGLRQKENQISF
jgi:hypothetical protein